MDTADAHDEYLRTMFHAMPLHQLLGFRFVDMGTDRVVIEMPVRPEAFNGSGNLHGGAVATLVDVAAGSCAGRASGFDPTTESLVTADLHVRYLGRPKGATVQAEARLIRAGRMLIVVEVRVTDPAGNMVAVADFSAMVVPRRGPLREGTRSDPRLVDL